MIFFLRFVKWESVQLCEKCSFNISVPALSGNFNSIQLRGMYMILTEILNKTTFIKMLESGLTCVLFRPRNALKKPTKKFRPIGWHLKHSKVRKRLTFEKF